MPNTSTYRYHRTTGDTRPVNLKSTSKSAAAMEAQAHAGASTSHTSLVLEHGSASGWSPVATLNRGALAWSDFAS